MSATERNDPDSPYGADTFFHPEGWIPNCLPSRATKMRAFCSPKPGIAFRLARSWLPSSAVVQMAAVSPAVGIDDQRRRPPAPAWPSTSETGGAPAWR